MVRKSQGRIGGVWFSLIAALLLVKKKNFKKIKIVNILAEIKEKSLDNYHIKLVALLEFLL